MQNLSRKVSARLTRLRCRIVGHDIHLSKEYKTHQREYVCDACKSQYTEDNNGFLTPLTPKWKRVNEVMEQFYLRRKTKTA
jgi:transposase-like protein